MRTMPASDRQSAHWHAARSCAAAADTGGRPSHVNTSFVPPLTSILEGASTQLGYASGASTGSPAAASLWRSEVGGVGVSEEAGPSMSDVVQSAIASPGDVANTMAVAACRCQMAGMGGSAFGVRDAVVKVAAGCRHPAAGKGTGRVGHFDMAAVGRRRVIPVWRLSSGAVTVYRHSMSC